MLNTNEKLLDLLNESEYYLLSIIARYGKKSCPKNDVLVSKTGWGINKVQKAKKSLIDKGLLEVTNRWKEVEGKRFRDSNEYQITTKLIGKYNGKSKESELSRFEVLQIELDENEVLRFEVDEFELDENEVGIKVLKVLIIESNKLLKKEIITKVSEYPSEIPTDILNVIEICKHYKEQTGNNYNLKDPNKHSLFRRQGKYKDINARIKDGATVQDCKDVITVKAKQWKGNKDMEQYLTFKTLFRKRNFEGYLDEVLNSSDIKSTNSTYTPIYSIPPNLDKRQRYFYFMARYEAYKPYLREYLINTEYRKKAILEQNAEGLCYELEQQNPKLAQIQVNFSA